MAFYLVFDSKKLFYGQFFYIGSGFMKNFTCNMTRLPIQNLSDFY